MADKPTRKPPAKKAPAKRAPRKPPAKAADGDATLPPEQMATVTAIKRNIGAQGRNARKYSPTNPAQLALQERRAQAYNLRRAGLTFQEIAHQISRLPEWPTYSKSTAADDVQAMRDGVTIQPVRQQLYEDLERVNALFTAVWPAAMRGDTKAVRTASALLDQRAKYLGLYSPIKQMLVGVDGNAIDLSDIKDPGDVYAATLERLNELLPPRPAVGDGK